MARDMDPDQATSWAAVIMLLTAFFNFFTLLGQFDHASIIVGLLGRVGIVGLIFSALVEVGLILAGIGLLRSWPRAWALAILVGVVEGVLDLSSLQVVQLLFDIGALYLLWRPSVRARFGEA